MAATFVVGSTQYATLSSSLGDLRNVTGGSLCAWVKPTTFPTTERFILNFSTGTSTSRSRLSLSMRASGSSFRTSARRLDANAVTSLDSTSALVAGTLYHVCAVAEYSNAILRLYINGVQNNSVAIAGWTGATSDTASLAATMAARTSTDSINGVLDDVRVYNRVLSANDVASIYWGGGRDTVVNGMVERWKFMDGALGAVLGTTRSIGSNQGGAVSVNSPVFSEALKVVPRRRRK